MNGLIGKTMKNGLKMIWAVGLGLAMLQLPARAEDKPVTPEKPSTLKDQKEKISYGIGMNIGSNLKRGGYEVDVDMLAGAIKDVLAGKELKMTDQEAREALQAFQRTLAAKKDEERRKTAEKNRKAGESFLEENKKKPGVKTHEVTMLDKSQAELQYKVLTEGTGEIGRKAMIP